MPCSVLLIQERRDDRPPIIHALPRLRSGPYKKRTAVEASLQRRSLPLVSKSSWVGIENADGSLQEVREDGQVFRQHIGDSLPYESRLVTFRYRDSRGSAPSEELISLQRVSHLP